MIYAVGMALCGMICLPHFMKIDIGVQAIVSFGFGNLRSYNICITCGRDV
jgi:hypothetical protein